MKKTLTILAILAVASAAWGNGVALNSPGTKALAMGGAFISIADDYSAPYWNPAGLQNSEGMQLTFFLTDVIPMATYKYTMPAAAGGAEIDAETEMNHYLAPNFAFLWNCKLNEKLRMGLSFIVPAGLGAEWDGADLTGFNGPSILGENPPGTPLFNQFETNKYKWESQIGVFNISLSTAYKFGEKLNVGGAFHLVRGTMVMKRGVSAVSNIDPATMPDEGLLDSQYEDETDGWGWGIGFGFQYMATEKITFAAAMRTRMTVGFSGDAKVTNSVLGTLADYEFDRDITWPLWVGGGFSFKASEKLILAAEAQWSQWSETEDYLIGEHEAEKDTLTLLWDDAVQIRFGGEYQVNETLALRGGFYIDPAPGPDETQVILIPNGDFLGFTFGVGYTVNKLTFDATIEYLKGTERDIADEDVLEDVGMPGKHGINILAPSFAITYKF